MTMGLAMILDGSLLLWADGLLRAIGDDGTPCTSEEDKIEIISPHLALMKSGVQMIGQRAINTIRLNYRPDLTLSDIIDLVEFSMTKAWENLEVEEGFDMENQFINCGLLTVGLADGQPFGLLAKQRYKQKASPQYTTEPWQVLVNYQDSEKALAIADEEINQLPEEVCAGPYADYLAAVVKMGASVIKRVAKNAPASVGGVIRCAISNRGEPFQKEIVEVV